jgi:hypothetical protein
VAGMNLRSFCFGLILLCAPAALVQPQSVKGEISDNTLKTLKSLAWQSLPSKIVMGKNKVLDIDKSDPSKIVIPDEDAREVIRVARLTARAHKCALHELVIANRDALLLRYKKTGKWTESQLQYINKLHLYTVQLLAGKNEFVDPEQPQPNFDPEQGFMPPADMSNCSDEEKQDILDEVEANEKLLDKS